MIRFMGPIGAIFLLCLSVSDVWAGPNSRFENYRAPLVVQRGDTSTTHSVAREWNEVLLECIRRDFARPTVHARNLFHVSIAMWDAWAIYDETASTYLMQEERPMIDAEDIPAARNEAISYAAYRVIVSRFFTSPGAATTIPLARNKMIELGYDPDNTGTVGKTPDAIGNRIAMLVQAYALGDLANEQDDYRPNNGYLPVNNPLPVADPGTDDLADPNRWQPLTLDFFVDQGGNVIPIDVQEFLGPHWGQLPPFALTESEEGPEHVFLDPGAPPMLSTDDAPSSPAEDLEYRDMFTDVARLQSVMDPDLPATIDIGPGARGNNTLGTEDGDGRTTNPVTGQPYDPNVVKLGDWSRCISEFWADGPDSETPPGHWNEIANFVTDNLAQKQIGGSGPVVDDLEWDVKLYLALNGANYDAAIAAWGAKGFYDYVRPISAIRYMCEQGQSSDMGQPSFNPQGILLEPGVVEVITLATTQPGQRHAHLVGNEGEIAIVGWLGVPDEPTSQTSGVDWILGERWVPYQRDTFVTPPFAGYVSGHSTYSRASAEIMTLITGTEYFPGGVGEFVCPAGEFLVFEDGPSETVVLQWATYYDAADESGISRLYGGIHPRADDFPGRIMGSVIGDKAWLRAESYFNGTAESVDFDIMRIF
jgi:hypothetical protein